MWIPVQSSPVQSHSSQRPPIQQPTHRKKISHTPPTAQHTSIALQQPKAIHILDIIAPLLHAPERDPKQRTRVRASAGREVELLTGPQVAVDAEGAVRGVLRTDVLVRVLHAGDGRGVARAVAPGVHRDADRGEVARGDGRAEDGGGGGGEQGDGEEEGCGEHFEKKERKRSVCGRGPAGYRGSYRFPPMQTSIHSRYYIHSQHHRACLSGLATPTTGSPGWMDGCPPHDRQIDR